MFYDRFVELCKKCGKSPAAVAREIGLSNSSTTSWKHGATPKTETLKKISQYFGVTVGYLLDGRKRLGDYCKGWKSNKAARLYMCIDSTLLDDLEIIAKEDNMTLEDKIEEILYCDVDRHIEEKYNEDLAREMQEWYGRHLIPTKQAQDRQDTPEPPPPPSDSKDAAAGENPLEGLEKPGTF